MLKVISFGDVCRESSSLSSSEFDSDVYNHGDEGREGRKHMATQDCTV